MGSRFVQPDTRVLKISNGDELVVRRRLTSGEQRAMFSRLFVTGDDGVRRANMMQVGLAVITAYLVDWSLRDDRVKIEGLSIADLERVLNNLSPEDFSEIRDAIEQHQDEMVAERDTAKKQTDGVNGSSATSPSVDVTQAGDSATSAP